MTGTTARISKSEERLGMALFLFTISTFIYLLHWYLTHKLRNYVPYEKNYAIPLV